MKILDEDKSGSVTLEEWKEKCHKKEIKDIFEPALELQVRFIYLVGIWHRRIGFCDIDVFSPPEPKFHFDVDSDEESIPRS